MCRLFATLAATPIRASEPFLTGSCSLLAQSCIDPKRKQADGWGLGWFDHSEPEVVKSPQPIFEDLKRCQTAAKKAKGTAIVGHIRWASNPLKLPKKELIGPVHTQPFAHGDWIFAHNGTLYIPKEAGEALGAWSRFIQGRNDSEVLFYWLMRDLAPVISSSKLQPRAVAKAVRKSLEELDRLWLKCRRRYPIYRFPYHGVNWVLTNGRRLFAFCYVNPKGFDKGRSLAHRRQPYFQLQWAHRRNQVMVASEPLDKQAWHAMKHGELLIAERHANQVRVRREKVR